MCPASIALQQQRSYPQVKKPKLGEPITAVMCKQRKISLSTAAQLLCLMQINYALEHSAGLEVYHNTWPAASGNSDMCNSLLL